MIIHLATGQPVQLHIHTEDGGQPPLIIAAPPAPAASSPVNAEPGRASRLAVLRLALVAAAFGLGGYYLAPASRMTSAAPAGLDDPAYRSAAQIPLTAAMVNDLARRVRENRGAAEEPG